MKYRKCGLNELQDMLDWVQGNNGEIKHITEVYESDTGRYVYTVFYFVRAEAKEV